MLPAGKILGYLGALIRTGSLLPIAMIILLVASFSTAKPAASAAGLYGMRPVGGVYALEKDGKLANNDDDDNDEIAVALDLAEDDDNNNSAVESKKPAGQTLSTSVMQTTSQWWTTRTSLGCI
ncbi:MAG TPA: hypothetical protein VHA09_00405 [Nitrososphaera sp.]|nr:hypothetical protein [Nitrososphaera sp.]